MASVFDELNCLNVNGHTERKNVGKDKNGKPIELTYLSWPWAWAEVVKRYPDANYEIVKNEQGLPYFSDPQSGIMVYTRVTIDGVTREMWLPVMDGANNAMKFEAYELQTRWGAKPVAAATMFDVNKTVMRCLVKNLAMFGLGLYIYAGEDLPEGETEQEPPKAEFKGQPAPQTAKAETNPVMDELQQFCAEQSIDKNTLARYRSMAVTNNILPGKGWLEYSMDEIKALEAFVIMNRK